MATKILGVLFTWLGIESLLAIYCLQYGIILISFPSSRFDSVLTFDLAWKGYGWWLGVPFLVKTAFTGCGVIMNLRGLHYSWVLRFVGASVGSTIWTSMLLKYISSGIVLTFGAVVAFDALILSFLIMAMAWHDFPEPRSTIDAGVP